MLWNSAIEHAERKHLQGADTNQRRMIQLELGSETDLCYVVFPRINMQECWYLARSRGQKISRELPSRHYTAFDVNGIDRRTVRIDVRK
jgi:hypothetical protein